MSIFKHLGIKKGTSTWEVPIYDNAAEAGSAYSYIKLGGTTGYIPLCATSDSRATAGRVKEHTGTILAIATSGIPAYKKVTYSTPGSYTFTVPGGVTKLRVEVAGAGGSGGTSAMGDDGWAHGGKGGNGAKVNTTLTVTPNTSITVVVGAGGSAPGGYNRNGNAGGSSSVGSISAAGGAGGRRGEEGTAGANAGNGAGGAGSVSNTKRGTAGSNGWVIIEYGLGVQ